MKKILFIILCFVIGVVFINAGTFIHELSHYSVARAFGCKASFGTQIFIGATNFECPADSPAYSYILIAFASLFFVFFIGLAIWLFAGKNAFIRLLALTMFMYSLLPSAYPLMPGSDAMYIVGQGFPVWIMWIIWGIMTGTVFYFIIKEIQDEDFIFGG